MAGETPSERDIDEPVHLPAVDHTPTQWADEHPQANQAEIAEGNRLGDVIDWYDDTDQGSVDTVRKPR